MLEELKPVKRWTVRKKIAVLWALDRGLATLEQVKKAHNLGNEEIDSWKRRYKPALLTSRASQYHDCKSTLVEGECDVCGNKVRATSTQPL